MSAGCFRQLERNQDQDKMARMILCGTFHTTTSVEPVPILWYKISPGPSPVPGPVKLCLIKPWNLCNSPVVQPHTHRHSLLPVSRKLGPWRLWLLRPLVIRGHFHKTYRGVAQNRLHVLQVFLLFFFVAELLLGKHRFSPVVKRLHILTVPHFEGFSDTRWYSLQFVLLPQTLWRLFWWSKVAEFNKNTGTCKIRRIFKIKTKI